VNSGVLLINAPLLREAEQQMLESKITLKYPDQDLLNHVLDGKIKRLPLKYNFIPGIDIIPPDKFSESEAEEARKHAVIWHFYAIKPYFHNSAVVNVYSAFFDNIKELGWHPEDFIKHEMKFTKSDEKAKIPFVGIKNGKVRFFGFRII
jgi:lipopolysaccharide biosynthesis glycosyltransferase